MLRCSGTTMRWLGLDDGYGYYVPVVPAVTLAVSNLMSLFALNRRWLGALLGHLAALELTSTGPNRRYSAGARRLGADYRARRYFDEHVEADAVHEQIAAHDLCGGYAASLPARAPTSCSGRRAAWRWTTCWPGTCCPAGGPGSRRSPAGPAPLPPMTPGHAARSCYLLPLRWHADGAGLTELTGYLRWVSLRCDVLIVDGSPPEVFARHHAAAGPRLRATFRPTPA